MGGLRAKTNNGPRGKVQVNQPQSQQTDVYGLKVPALKVKIVSKVAKKK